jgi:hypothetical protein
MGMTSKDDDDRARRDQTADAAAAKDKKHSKSRAEDAQGLDESLRRRVERFKRDREGHDGDKDCRMSKSEVRLPLIFCSLSLRAALLFLFVCMFLPSLRSFLRRLRAKFWCRIMFRSVT